MATTSIQYYYLVRLVSLWMFFSFLGSYFVRPTNSVIYGTVRYTLQAIRCCASYVLLNRLGLGINSKFVYAINTRRRARYILLSRLGLGINFIQWIPLRSYSDTRFVSIALFVVTPITYIFKLNLISAEVAYCYLLICLLFDLFNCLILYLFRFTC